MILLKEATLLIKGFTFVLLYSFLCSSSHAMEEKTGEKESASFTRAPKKNRNLRDEKKVTHSSLDFSNFLENFRAVQTLSEISASERDSKKVKKKKAIKVERVRQLFVSALAASEKGSKDAELRKSLALKKAYASKIVCKDIFNIVDEIMAWCNKILKEPDSSSMNTQEFTKGNEEAEVAANVNNENQRAFEDLHQIEKEDDRSFLPPPEPPQLSVKTEVTKPLLEDDRPLPSLPNSPAPMINAGIVAPLSEDDRPLPPFPEPPPLPKRDEDELSNRDNQGNKDDQEFKASLIHGGKSLKPPRPHSPPQPTPTVIEIMASRVQDVLKSKEELLREELSRRRPAINAESSSEDESKEEWENTNEYGENT